MSSSATTMPRYIKRFARVGHSLGPSEERGFALWVGYDIEGVSGDLSPIGLIAVASLSDSDLSERGVTSFVHVGPGDKELRQKLGLETG